MKALVHDGPGATQWRDVPDPVVQDDTDAVVRVDAFAICGTDLQSLRGDVATVREGTVYGRSVTHHFSTSQVIRAYGTFARAAETGVFEVVVER